MTVILTACTMRKRFSPDPALRAATLAKGSLHSVGQDWRNRVAEALGIAEARNVYAGRGMMEAKKAAAEANACLFIASAGLGLVEASDVIPSYDLTVAKGLPSSIMSKLPHGTTEAGWWDEIATKEAVVRFETRLSRDQSHLLVALPASYLKMLGGFLTTLSAFKESRVRIFTGSEHYEIDPELKPFHMPYDRRLDGGPAPGTLGDFAQRALRHFVTGILPVLPTGDAKSHAQQVTSAQFGWNRPVSKSGIRLEDDQLLKTIRKEWDSVRGNSTKLLRKLRDELGIACEQGRFARLAARVRAERVQQ
ncbi:MULTISPECIES: hypothetical protein [Rhizobium/Agrobacterium group]|uniref:hypothetical protein n=1 Tax=Rhizobium/Agrobacterium group TaxID=227290 RepID=UPI0012E9716E|nr:MULTISPECIES: hypothetical protein [Rhizobium/Agrobacterium group]MCF1475066.1 hypothetical protein [Allorhizobium ampelinum]MVA52720.1 hypothetical protein [Agrobacterium vitis]NSZ55477.1 hypothetical protein [Agrobacterium vitis]NTA34543.1 hypothetical protein [Agrobacterium vitis]